jgi:hypothetical protein
MHNATSFTEKLNKVKMHPDMSAIFISGSALRYNLKRTGRVKGKSYTYDF